MTNRLDMLDQARRLDASKEAIDGLKRSIEASFAGAAAPNRDAAE